MKINKIRIGCRKESISGELGSGTAFYLFRSPVTIGSGAKAVTMSGCSALFISAGFESDIKSADGQPIRYDSVAFRLNASEKQYLTSLGIVYGEPVSISDDFVITGILRCLKAQSVRKGKELPEFSELAMRLILLAVGGFSEDDEKSDEKRVPRYAELKAIRESIYEDPTGSWETEALAEEMGISRTYFHRLYLAAFGVTCRQDVIESRLYCAADLLANTDMSVSEIAEQCGYESDSYFMRQFKQHKGCTPTEYRNRINEPEL